MTTPIPPTSVLVAAELTPSDDRSSGGGSAASDGGGSSASGGGSAPSGGSSAAGGGRHGLSGGGSPAAGSGRHGLALLGGALGMAFVGGSVAVSSTLAGSPLFTGQAVRYAVACVLLLVAVRARGQRVRRPRGRQWLWLLAVSAGGLVVFNLALILGARHAEPAVLAVAVACVPLALAAIGPLLEGAVPTVRVIVAALVVTVGAAVVEGFGRADAVGLLWALVVSVCEAVFTLAAVPVLGSLGAHGVAVHSTWIGAVGFAVLGLAIEGPTAVLRLTVANLVALAYLAVAVTAVAFVLWYTCVQRVGAGRSGLLTGVAPVSATVTGVALGAPVPGIVVWLGVVVVAIGLAVEFSAARTPARRRPSPN